MKKLYEIFSSRGTYVLGIILGLEVVMSTGGGRGGRGLIGIGSIVICEIAIGTTINKKNNFIFPFFLVEDQPYFLKVFLATEVLY